MPETPDNPSTGDHEQQPRHIHQMTGFWPLVVFALTLATHSFYIYEMATHPFFNFPLVDSDTYHRQADDILHHGWLGEKAFWQAPLYPYFLAACYHFIKARFFDIRVIQAVIAAMSALLLYEVGRRKVGPGVGRLAAVAVAFYGPLVFFDGEMLAPVLVVLFYLLIALALDRAIYEQKVAWWPAAGVWLGLAALAHGLGLFIAPLVCLYGVFGRDMRSLPRKKRLLAVALFASATALTIAPVTLRNRMVSGEWVLISHNGPINFYIGNHPDYDRMVGLRPGLEWASLARSLNEEEISTVRESSRYFTRAAWANIRQQPAAVGRVWLKKVYLFFHADEIKRNYPIYPVRDHSRLMWALMWKWPGPEGMLGLGFPFGLVLPLAALGWWELRRKGIRLIAVELIMAGHFAANLMFFTCARYRVPLAPFFLIYAAAAVRWIFGERIWRPRSLLLHWRPLAIALGAFLVSNSHLTPMDNPEDRAEYQFHLGYVCQHTKKPQEALEHYVMALRDNPDNTETHFFLGILYQDHLRQPTKALEQFDWVLARDPDNMPVMFNRALSLAALGKTDEAKGILEILVKNDPENEKYRDYLDQLSGKATPPQSESRTPGEKQ
jgi:4-amino-4-deoxy-L-arabinose transferase-like glycosyltransferase